MRRLADVVVDQRPLVMSETASVLAACTQMAERRAGSVLVTDTQGDLVGIFTGRDVVCNVLAAGKDAVATPLSQVMTRDPVTMSPDRSAVDALRLMWDGGFRHVPLIQGARLIGVVSRG